MIYRRPFLTFVAASALFPFSVRAQAADRASAFVKTTGDRLVAVVNNPGATGAKRTEMTQIIDAAVDVDGVGRFCLGRYWRQATSEQQKRYLTLFHEVLVTNITAKLGEYQGVRFTMGRSRPQDDEVVVSTVVERPNNPPTAVDWIISNPSSDPKIIDVVAEGTSLRLTQRSDYASYLTHNNNDINALITAMKTQVSQSS
ncbi:MAG: ABC transporter substrate-binding protein [Rhodopila sp.]|nr:ABC transporter substrate-binding protein [Rhodopila sp.]